MLRILSFRKAKDLCSVVVDLLALLKPGYRQFGTRSNISRSRSPTQKPRDLRTTRSVSTLLCNNRLTGLSSLKPLFHYQCYSAKAANEDAAIKINYKTRKPLRWTETDVIEWAKSELQFSNEDLAALNCCCSPLDGSHLLKTSIQDLVEAGIAGGLAGQLLDELMIANAPAICELLPRDAEEFQYLTNEEKMRASINTFKPLPQIGHFAPVKGYTSSTHIFITEEQYKVWKMYFDNSNANSTKLLVPSGPYGIGKSGIGYLVALTAYLLKKPLFYYVSYNLSNLLLIEFKPNCSKVITKKNMEDVLLLWNKDLMDTNPDLAAALTTLQIDETPGASEFWSAFTRIPGAVIIFDEHNELYRMQEYSEAWYSIYTSFQTFQAANFVSFIGSAHSKLPDGYRNCASYLQPLTFAEVKHFITATNSPLSDLQWEKLPGKTQHTKLRKLYSAVGGVYHLLVELHEHLKSGLSFDSFLISLKTTYSNRLEQSEKEFLGHDKEYFLAFLKSIANHNAHCITLEAKEASVMYHDCGMVYIKCNSVFPVNDTALAVIKAKANGATVLIDSTL